MKLKEIMTTNVEVVPPDCSVKDAAAKMAEFDVGSLPVCDGTKILGQVTDRDITIKVTAEGMSPEQVTVGDIMTSPIIWAYDDMNVREAAEMMQDHQIRRLIVIDRNKKLVGIVALGDLARQMDEKAVGETLEEISKSGQMHH